MKIHMQTPMYPYTHTLTFKFTHSVNQCDCIKPLSNALSQITWRCKHVTGNIGSGITVRFQLKVTSCFFSIENVIEIIIPSHTFVRNYRDIQYLSYSYFCNSNILQNYRILGPGFDTNKIYCFQISPV